jgi:hypothetical protein
MPDDITPEELSEAIRAFASSISKCEKAKLKLKNGSPQSKWVERQLEAFYISVSLIENLQNNHQPTDKRYGESELTGASKTIQQLIEKCEKLPGKFKDGSPQQTLAIRRLRAFEIAAALIERETILRKGFAGDRQ